MEKNENERKKYVAEKFGIDIAQYLENKHRGGASGAKGGKYEQLFASHKLVRLAQRLFNEGVDAEVEAQSYCFVDDFVVTVDDLKEHKAYQLKNSNAESWNAGNHPICTDFSMQHAMAVDDGYERVQLRLVSSNDGVAKKLNESVPDGISGYSKAIYFPYNEQPTALLREHNWLLEDFHFMCRTEKPSMTECSNVALVLMGTWAGITGKVKVSEVLERARQCSPTLIRPLRRDAEALEMLRPGCKAILDNIPNFIYTLTRGFFAWEASAAATSGILSFDCFDPRFEKFQTFIESAKPTSFEDIEGMLI